jgi:iron complex outermembrane receptor protein
MLRKVLTIAAMGIALPALAQAPHTYGDTLIDGLMAAHRDIAGVEIHSTARDGTPIVLTRGVPGAAGAETLPLANSMGETIGTIGLCFRGARHVSAAAVAQAAARKVYLANNLIEADPFVTGAHRNLHAQALVDRMMAANPDLVTLGLHIGASGASNAILASNFGRIGKPGDKDDARVIDKGETLKEPTNGGRRLAVSLPLLDHRGRVVGGLSTSFVVGPGGNAVAEARAVEIRNRMARQIASLAQITR